MQKSFIFPRRGNTLRTIYSLGSQEDQPHSGGRADPSPNLRVFWHHSLYSWWRKPLCVRVRRCWPLGEVQGRAGF